MARPIITTRTPTSPDVYKRQPKPGSPSISSLCFGIASGRKSGKKNTCLLYTSTLILELTWGILLFGLRGPAQRNLIGKVYLATQIILNLGLCYGTLYLGPMWGNFLYCALEVLVFLSLIHIW